MKRRIFFIALALAIPLALLLPLRAVRSWQPRVLELPPSSPTQLNEIANLFWRRGGLVLFRRQSNQGKDARTTTHSLANWSGQEVKIHTRRGNLASLDGAGEVAAQLQYLGGGHYDVLLADVASARTFERATATLRQSKGHSHFGYKALALSPDATRLAADLIGPNAVQIADARSGEIKAYFILPWRVKEAKIANRSVDTSVWALAWSPDGRQLAIVGSRHVWFLDAQGQLLRSWRKPPFPFDIKEFTVRAHYSPDGKTLAISTGHAYYRFFSGRGTTTSASKIQLRLHNVQDGATAFEWAETSDSSIESEGVTNLDFSPDSKTLAFGTFDGNAHLVDLKSGVIERHFATPNAQMLPNPAHYVAFAPDGNTLAVASPRKIMLWRVK